MDNNNSKLYDSMKYILPFSLFILSIVIYNNAFYNNKPTCRRYIVNTYLYVVFGLILIGCAVYYWDRRNTNFSFTAILLSFIASIILIVSLFLVKQPIANHLLWILFLITLAVIFYPIYSISRYSGLFTTSLITVTTLMIILTFIAFKRPDWITYKMRNFVFWGLLSLIILGIVLMFSKNIDKYNKWWAAGIILIFIFAVLVDTKDIQTNARLCVIPNYPTASISLILDSLNLFSGVTTLQI